MSTVIISPYRENWFPAITSLFQRAVRNIASRDYDPTQIAAWLSIDESAWRRKLADADTRVAWLDNQPIGFIAGKAGYIDLLFVSPDVQRRGVASALLARLERDMAVDRLSVHASITAKPFFLRQGYRVIERESVTVRGAQFTRYAMEKRFTTLRPDVY